MANILALEWDNHEARIAVARRRGNDALIEHAFTVDLAAPSAGQSLADADVGQRIAAALAMRHIGRCDTLVAVGRSDIELRLLSLPQAPDAELPEMVRFQAQRQFTTLGDDWPLDFFPIDGGLDATRSVLAAAISPDLVEQIHQHCQAAQLRLRRLVLRPCAAASLVLRQHEGRDNNQVRLLVDVLIDEADLTVTVDQTVVFMRTVRLPGQLHSAEQTQTLVAEIRRTVAAAQNQLGGQAVEQLVLFGPDEEFAELRSQIEEKLQLPSTGFDPFRGLSPASELRGNLPSHPGRFAPLLGMLVDECTGRRHAIDFLDPRRKPPPPSRTRLYVAAAAVAASVVLAVVGLIRMKLNGLEASRQQRQNELAVLEKEIKTAERSIFVAERVDRWAAADITWLDELHRLATRLPPSRNVRLGRLQIDASSATGGKMRLQGYVDGPGTISKLEGELRDATHHVFGDGGRRDSDDPDYPWQFDTTVTIDAIDPNTDSRAEPPAASLSNQQEAEKEPPSKVENSDGGTANAPHVPSAQIPQADPPVDSDQPQRDTP